MLLSKQSQFLTDMQYLFYLLNDHNRKQSNADTFSELNITDPRVKYTAESYLVKL